MKITDILDGSTPLIVHCASVDYENLTRTNFCDVFLHWLIDNGCPINRANNKGETAIFCAVLKGNFQLIQTLVNHSGK